MTEYYLKGRSIDGTVYFEAGNWTSNIHDAGWMSHSDASNFLAQRVQQNARVELDSKIGQLEVLEVSQGMRDYNTLVNYLTEGNSIEDLAKMYLTVIGSKGQKELMTEMDQYAELDKILDEAEEQING